MPLLRQLSLLDVKDILGRALIEPAFRAKLLADCDGVLTALGLQPSAQAREFFGKLNSDSFGEAAAMIDLQFPRPPLITFK